MNQMKKIIALFLGFLFLLGTAESCAEDDIQFPAELSVIEDEAFEGVPINDLTIPESITQIHSRAFADCGLEHVVLPDSLTYIAPDAFDGCTGLYATVSTGSYAAQWCEENSIPVAMYTKPGVEYRTQEEILAFIDEHPVSMSAAVTFRQSPTGGSYSSGTYAPGLLSEASIENALNMLNQFRFIAGLNADVANWPEKEEMMGAAAMLNGLNGSLSHYPARPEVLSDSIYDSLYEMGYEAASSSNIGAGYTSLADSIYRGYMPDSGSSNISRVGHRRWILNPSMGKTAFGYYEAPNTAYKRYSGMYAFDRSGSGTQTMVAWPAQQTPLTHFYSPSTHPWSLNFGWTLSADTIRVEVNRLSDGKEWTFSSESADGDFYVDNGGYGMRGCVIFRLSGIGTISAGDRFAVSVTDGTKHIVVQYTVEFF